MWEGLAVVAPMVVVVVERWLAGRSDLFCCATVGLACKDLNFARGVEALIQTQEPSD